MKNLEETTTDLALRLDDQHPVVARLIELQGKTSDQKFAARWLTCTVSSWSRIRSGKYHAKDAGRMLEKLETDLAALERHHAVERATVASDIVGVSLITMGMRAVDRAFAEVRDRMVAILAPTGGGKTTFRRALKMKHKGLLEVEASETWRSSYLAACHAFLLGLGVTTLPAGTRAAERVLLETLKADPKLIVIDEAHYFGPATINLIKAILNQTTCTVVMLSIPDLWARMKRNAWQESEQLRSRTCAIVEVKDLSTQDVAMVFARRLEGALRAGQVGKDEAEEMVAAIRGEANRFGLMATVARILAEIEADTAEGERLTPELVLKACGTVAALRR